jgi:hypothetical protein
VVTAAPVWHSAAPMPERRSYFAAAQIGGRVYVSGGMVGATGKYVLRLERFDAIHDRWLRLRDQPAPARAAAGASLGRSLYVVGGQTPSGVTRRVLAFDTRTARWSRKPALPSPRYNAAAASLNGKLYVVGGVRRIDPVRTASVLRGGRWHAIAPVPQALHTQALVSYRGELWSIGGFDTAGDPVRSVWIYSPRSGAWRRGPRLAAPIAMVGATVSDGRVYAVSEHVFESYRPGVGWRRGAPLAVPRHALGLFAVAGRLWAVGGCVVPELADSRVVEFTTLSP